MFVTRRSCRRCGTEYDLGSLLLRRAGYDFRSPIGVTYECVYRAACDAFLRWKAA